MSLITMTNQDQSPYQFRVKFNSGSLTVPKNGQVGLLHFKAERGHDFIINSTNDTFILFQGLNDMVKLENTTGHIDYIRPILKKIPHGLYNFSDARNTNETTGLTTFSGSDAMIVPTIAKILNTDNPWGNSLYTAQLIKAPEAGEASLEGDLVILIKAKLINKVANTNVLVDFEQYEMFNTNDSTITTTDVNSQLSFLPTNHSNVIISKNNMLMCSELNNGNVSFLMEAKFELPDAGGEVQQCKGSFIGFANDFQLGQPYNLNKSPVINELNEANLAPLTVRPLGSNMPIVVKINDNGDVIVEVRSIDEDPEGNLLIGNVVGTLSRTGGGNARLTDVTGGNPQLIRVKTTFHTNGKLKLIVQFIKTDTTVITLTDTDGAGGNGFLFISDLIPEFLNHNVKTIVHYRNTNSPLRLRGKDRVVGIQSGVSADPMILENGSRGSIMCGIIHHEIPLNQIMDLGNADGYFNGVGVKVRPSANLNRLSKQCNADIFNIEPESAMGRKIVNKTGSGSFFNLVGRRSATQADPNANDHNGAMLSGVVQTGEDQRPEYKVQIKSLQGINSLVGNNINGGVDKTIYMGTFYDGTTGLGDITVVDKETPIMIDLNNKEDLHLTDMEINITDIDGKLRTDLRGSTNLCLIVKEKFNPILFEQSSKPLATLNNEEEAFKEASKIN